LRWRRSRPVLRTEAQNHQRSSFRPKWPRTRLPGQE
jgi:hypothetical protein